MSAFAHPLERKASGTNSRRVLTHDFVRSALSSASNRLTANVRREAENAFGWSFDNARVHHNPTSEEAANKLGGRAFTVGTDVMLANSVDSEHLTSTIGHELAHVVATRSVAAQNAHALSDPAGLEERSASQAGASVASGRTTVVDPAPLRVVHRETAHGNAAVRPKQSAAGVSRRANAEPLSPERVVPLLGSEAPAIVHDVLRSPGEPLDQSTRSFMESRFQHDFAQVRVHTNSEAAESARSVGALAYASGQHIAFGSGYYAPTLPIGRTILAHELAHTIQQASARSGTPAIVDNPVLESEAHGAAYDALSGSRLRSMSTVNSVVIPRQTTLAKDPIQQKLDAFRATMLATYNTPDGPVTVAPPFGMGEGYDDQKTTAADSEHKPRLEKARKRAKLSDHTVSSIIQYARGSPSDIRVLTQALIETYDAEGTWSVLPRTGAERVSKMMYDYRISIDCAGYVQQAYLFATGLDRGKAGFKIIQDENLSDLEHRGFSRTSDPSAALAGDLVALESVKKHEVRPGVFEQEVGHSAIVFSQYVASEGEKKKVNDHLLPLTAFSKPGEAVLHFEVDSSWGSGGDIRQGGVIRQRWWYNVSSKKWASLVPPSSELASSRIHVDVTPYVGLRAVIEKGPAAVSESPSPQPSGLALRAAFPAVG